MSNIHYLRRPPPGIKRALRANVSELNGLASDLDDMARAARRIAERKGCTGAPALEAMALKLAANVGKDAEAISLMAVATVEREMIERESA